jgi:asparagine synthase (glutamine-hydrolysing)
MCGIVGTLNLTRSHPIREVDLRRMLAMIRHRGPDQFGIYLDDHVGLGSARLSIIDLEGGQQPITNEDASLWIVFNGEIFNYLELRPDLEARGHAFATHTDTEVLLHLYEEYGPDCLQKLNGQFAFAVWDARRRSLFLARDRLGVRPLFYTLAEGALVFGSEIKALLADRRVHGELDPIALDQIFTYWSTLSPRTVFRGIVELPPGHFLVAREGETTVQRYWQPRFPVNGAEPAAGREAEEAAAERLRELLIDATRIRLRADVPVGAYLSGGLDSSTIAAIIRHYTGARLDTFSIAFDDPAFDESDFQRRMARFLGTEHQVVQATHADIGQVFPEVIWHTETPVLRTSPAPMYLLSKLVRDRGYKVVLTGEGADEFLAGYDIFKEAKVRRFWARRPDSAWRPALLRRLYPDIGGLQRTNRAFLSAFFGERLADVDAVDYSHALRWRNTARAKRFFAPELAAAISQQSAADAPRPHYPPEFLSWHPLARGQYLEISIFLSQYLLSSQGDRVAMAHSVEGRFPFLDYRVVEFCNALPARWKLRGLTEKHLLKKVARTWLPEEIWQRPKRPYRAPIHRSFFHERTPDYVQELLGAAAIRAKGYFNPAAVKQLVEKIQRGQFVGEADDMALAGVLSTQLVDQLFLREFKSAPPLWDGANVKVCDARRASARAKRPEEGKARPDPVCRLKWSAFWPMAHHGV